MRRVLLLAITLGASGCFPDYSVGNSGSGGAGDTPGMMFIDATGVEFEWKVDHYGEPPADFTVNFDYDFEIDELEVTVGRFRQWAENGGNNYVVPSCSGCSLDLGGPLEAKMLWDSTWKTQATNPVFEKGSGFCDGTSPGNYGPETTYEMDDAEYPMTCVNWYQAVAFCAFEGKRLPTEAEWLYVASSRGTRPDYPWGKEWSDCSDATINYNADDQPANYCEFPVEVGSAGDDETDDGVQDMGGSVFEWVWDRPWVAAEWPDGEVRYTGPATAEDNRLRNGGSYISTVNDPRGRNDAFESMGDYVTFYDHGFRCAKSVK